MTPKTQYQKMRDNRARRESMLTNADEFEPLSDTHINGVRFKPGSLWDPARPMVATLEDGSVLTASSPVWYPDDSGEWIEGSPNNLPKDVMVKTWLHSYERENKRYCEAPEPTKARNIAYIPSIVAYKLAK